MAINNRTLLSRVFYSPSEKRFHAGWRIMIQSTLLLFLLFLTSVPLMFFSFSPSNIENFYLVIGVVTSLVSITLSIFISRKLLDHRKFLSLGLEFNSHIFKDLLVGTLIPGFMMGLIFSLELYFGWISIQGFVWSSLPIKEIIFGLASSFLLYSAVAWQEELLSRGYYLQNLIEGLSTSWGVLSSSFLFSLV